MIRLLAASGLLALVGSGCVRMELEEGRVSKSDAAVQITGADDVVLCPLEAYETGEGTVGVLWAGYPPGEDTLQLRSVTLSAKGAIVEPARSLGYLDDELVSLEATALSSETSVRFTERGSAGPVELRLDTRGDVAAIEALPETSDGYLRLEDPCVEVVNTTAGRLEIFRAEHGGELSLFAQLISES